MLELGGAQGNTLYTVDNLDKTRFDVVLICGPGGILDNQATEIRNVKLYYVSSLIRQVNPIKDFVALINLTKILRTEKPDIVHTHSSKAGILGRWAAYFAGTHTIIHTYHGFGFNDFQNWLVKSVYVLAERLSSLISDRLIVVSNENISYGLKNKIGRREQYMVIRSGIKTGKYQQKYDNAGLRKELGIRPDEKVVTTIGPFKPQKNTIDFIVMAKRVSDMIPNTKFIVIGDGTLRPQIESKITEFSIQDKAVLLGWRTDIPQLLSMTDIFVLTSLWEGLPRSIVESMISGKPVVAYAVDGSKEIVHDNVTGYLVKPKDVDTLCDKVVVLLKDTRLREEFGKAAVSAVKTEFDIDYMVKQQEQLYGELMK
jgi:glycosyltransferase involved in cell wall biosynthesis